MMGLVAAQSCAIIPSMARHTDSQAPADGPDLFSFAPKAEEQVAQPVAVAKLTVTQPQVILPDDLDKALSCLSLSDIERLRQAVERQYKQRGLVGAERRDGSPVAKPEPRSTEGTSQRRQQAAASKTGKVKGEPLALTQSKINAIRAAFKAGVKPTMICRQFGVSQAAVRQALKAG